jgi:hypothetical protein
MRRASWRIAEVRRGRSPFTSKKQKAMGHLTEAQYKIIADRMIEEHRKYGDRLRPGHWADVAARKVASHMADFCEGERMYTESAVRAMLNEIRNLADGYWNEAGHGAPDMLSPSEIDCISERGGIFLDPA